MSDRRIVGINPWFQAEISNALFKLAVATSITLDGTTPTTTVGLLLTAGAVPLQLRGQNAVRSLKAIEVTASAKLNYEYLYG